MNEDKVYDSASEDEKEDEYFVELADAMARDQHGDEEFEDQDFDPDFEVFESELRHDHGDDAFERLMNGEFI